MNVFVSGGNTMSPDIGNMNKEGKRVQEDEQLEEEEAEEEVA